MLQKGRKVVAKWHPRPISDKLEGGVEILDPMSRGFLMAHMARPFLFIGGYDGPGTMSRGFLMAHMARVQIVKGGRNTRPDE